MSKVLVIISTAEKEKAMTGLIYAANSIKNKWLDDVRVVLFGPFEKLVAGDQELQEKTAALMEYQTPVACKFFSDKDSVSGSLEALGYKVDYVGAFISSSIDEGYIPMVF